MKKKKGLKESSKYSKCLKARHYLKKKRLKIMCLGWFEGQAEFEFGLRSEKKKKRPKEFKKRVYLCRIKSVLFDSHFFAQLRPDWPSHPTLNV